MTIFSARASAFYSMTCDQMSEWFSSVGLDMYSDLVMTNLLTGEILAGIVNRPGTTEFVVSRSRLYKTLNTHMCIYPFSVWG